VVHLQFELATVNNACINKEKDFKEARDGLVEYTAEVDELNTKLDKSEDKMIVLNSQISGLKQQLAALQSEVSYVYDNSHKDLSTEKHSCL